MHNSRGFLNFIVSYIFYTYIQSQHNLSMSYLKLHKLDNIILLFRFAWKSAHNTFALYAYAVLCRAFHNTRRINLKSEHVLYLRVPISVYDLHGYQACKTAQGISTISLENIFQTVQSLQRYIYMFICYRPNHTHYAYILCYAQVQHKMQS